ncbi:MAG: hypothetical protein AB1815_03320 [Bacillota bacterium]|jgi:hypothetical protein
MPPGDEWLELLVDGLLLLLTEFLSEALRLPIPPDDGLLLLLVLLSDALKPPIPDDPVLTEEPTDLDTCLLETNYNIAALSSVTFLAYPLIWNTAQ